MLIAEDLLLLFYDDESGRASFDGTKVSYALAGAVLVELSMLGRVDVARRGEAVRAGRIVIHDESPTGDDVLDTGLKRLSRAAGRKPKSVLGSLRKGVREQLLERLADSGRMRRETIKILGLFPATRWPCDDIVHKTRLRENLRSALVYGTQPDDRTAALISLLVAVDGITKVVPSDDKRATKRRAKEISESDWASEAVRKAVQEVNSAVIAAISAAGAAGAAGGS